MPIERFFLPPANRTAVELAPPNRRPLEFHRRMPGYVATPLVALDGLATSLGARRIWGKNETSRLGLPSFKVLGASWAIYSVAIERLGREPEWQTISQLREAFATLDPITLVTATDGNHGRAVAHIAKSFGFRAEVLVPQGMAKARIDALRAEGAHVIQVDGSYDDAVDESAAHAEKEGGRVLLSDTSWEGNTKVCDLIVRGYSTMFFEIEDAISEVDSEPIDIVFVQMGVGSLAAAAVAHYGAFHPRTKVIGVEPDSAACLFESAKAGKIVKVPGPHLSVMAGLNCGLASFATWPMLQAGLSAYLTLDDASAVRAVRALSKSGLAVGETGASGIAAAMELLGDEARTLEKESLGIGEHSNVLVLLTEGPTDPASYGEALSRPTVGPKSG